MRRTIVALAILAVSVASFWCGGTTVDANDDSGIFSCTFLAVDETDIQCYEADAAGALERCHHVLDTVIDGGLDAEIVPHRCAAGGGGCCTYPTDAGPWTVCYYADAFPPSIVQGFCANLDGSYGKP